MTNDNLLQHGIVLAKQGDFQHASIVLAKVVKDDPLSEQGWLWLGRCRTVPREKIYCFGKVVSINPNNAEANQELLKLKAESSSFSSPQIVQEQTFSSTSNISQQPTAALQTDIPTTSTREKVQASSKKKWGHHVIYLLIGVIIGMYVSQTVVRVVDALGYFQQFDVMTAMRTINVPEFSGPSEAPAAEPTPAFSLSDPYEKRLERAWPLIIQAENLMNSHQYNNAIPILNRVLEIVPEYADAYYLSGVSYFQLKDSQRAKSEYDYYVKLAVEKFDQAINLEPKIGDYYIMRGRAYATLGAQQYPRFDFQQLERIAVENFNYGGQLPIRGSWDDKEIVLYDTIINAGDCEEVIPSLKELLKLETEPSPRLHSILADAYYCVGDLDNALTQKNEAYRLSPSSICLCDRAIILYGLGRTDEAMADIEKSLDSSPYYSGHRYYIRALLYADQGNLEQAQRDLDFGITQTWVRGGLLSYVQGKIALAQGKKEEAISYFRDAEATYSNEGPMLEKIRQDLIDLGGTLQESEIFPFSVTSIPLISTATPINPPPDAATPTGIP